jgi:hypothetical protein
LLVPFPLEYPDFLGPLAELVDCTADHPVVVVAVLVDCTADHPVVVVAVLVDCKAAVVAELEDCMEAVAELVEDRRPSTGSAHFHSGILAAELAHTVVECGTEELCGIAARLVPVHNVARNDSLDRRDFQACTLALDDTREFHPD